MDVAEPRVRRRGFFVHVETPVLDHVEQGSTEGTARLRVSRPRADRAMVSSSRKPTHAVRTTSLTSTHSTSELRLESETGSHRQARMSR